MNSNKGFTLIEMMITVAMVSILVGIAIPNILEWLPDFRLKVAARALYSDMQLAKMTAVKENQDCSINFTSGTSYTLSTSNGIFKTVLFAEYKSSIEYGHGDSTKDATGTAWSSGADHRTYSDKILTFNSRGNLKSVDDVGYVYIQNINKKTAYCVGTPYMTGVIVLLKWNATAWK